MLQGIEEGLAIGKSEGLQLGIEQGIEKRKEHVARKMLDKGLSIDVIVEFTNLSLITIKKLQEN